MKRVTVPVLLAVIALSGCGGSESEPSQETLNSEAVVTYMKLIDEKKASVAESGMSGDPAERLAKANAALEMGRRARSFFDRGDEARGKAAAHAIDVSPEEIKSADPSDFPAAP